MSQSNRSIVQAELQAIAERKSLLPAHRVEIRYQNALRQDESYRDMIFASLAMAIVAGSGFGHLAQVSSFGPSALLIVGSVGLMIRACPFEGTSEGFLGYLGSKGLGVLLFAVGLAVCLATCGLSGIVGLKASGIALCALLVSLGCSKVGFLQRTWPILLMIGTGLIGSRTHLSPIVAGHWSIPGTILGLLIGFMAMLTCSGDSEDRVPTLSLSSAAWLLWAIRISSWFDGAVLGSLLAVATLVGTVWLIRALGSRNSFAPVLILVILFHLGGSIAGASRLLEPVAPQIVLVVLEFCLLGMASYRQALASLERYPRATYRSTPQCVVPTLDHAWDHPIKIDAA